MQIETMKRRIPVLTVVLIYNVYVIGAAGHLWDQTFELMRALTSLTLFLTGGVVFALVVLRNGIPVLVWGVGTFLVTFFLEVAGVQTGVVFGAYRYGNVLDPSLFGAPLVIGFNWVLVVLGSACVADWVIQRIPAPPHTFSADLVFSGITGAVAVGFDVLLEPVAIALGYWSWDGGYVPAHNYIAWFVISFAAAFVLRRLRILYVAPIAIHYLVAQSLYLTVLLLGRGM
jgi:bisanhydrobacterioruberin hydratase